MILKNHEHGICLTLKEHNLFLKTFRITVKNFNSDHKKLKFYMKINLLLAKKRSIYQQNSGFSNKTT